MKREGRAVWPTYVVGAAEGKESSSGLARTGRIYALDVQALSHDLRVSDEVGCVRRVEIRVEAERHRVAESEIGIALVCSRGGNRGDHEQDSRREHREQSSFHKAYPPRLRPASQPEAKNVITNPAGTPLRTWFEANRCRGKPCSHQLPRFLTVRIESTTAC